MRSAVLAEELRLTRLQVQDLNTEEVGCVALRVSYQCC